MTFSQLTRTDMKKTPRSNYQFVTLANMTTGVAVKAEHQHARGKRKCFVFRMLHLLTPHSLIDQSDSITVKVGDEQEKYTLHTKLLAYHLGYFRGALSGKFKETDDGMVVLTDVDTDAFEVLIDWMYNKRLPAPIHAHFLRDSRDPSIRCRAYVLADRLLVPNLKVALMDVLFRVALTDKCYAAVDSVVYFSDHLPDDDPIHRLMVDCFCINNGIEELKINSTMASTLPQPFLIRVVLKLDELHTMGEDQKKLRREDYLFQ
jgi:hypothetical protein